MKKPPSLKTRDEHKPEVPALITYSNLLYRAGTPDAPEVREFLHLHKDNPAFLQRVDAMNKLFNSKNDLKRQNLLPL